MFLFRDLKYYKIMHFHLAKKQRRRKKFKFRLKLYSFLTAFLLLIAGSGYILRYSELFKIYNIEITGIEDERKKIKFLSSIEKTLFENPSVRILGEDNYFSWPEKIKPLNPEHEEIMVSKYFFENKIKIDVKQKEKLGIWCKMPLEPKAITQCFWLNQKDGSLITEAPATKGQLIYQIDETQTSQTKESERVMKENLFENFKKILIALKDFNISVKSIFFDESLEELKVATKENTEIIFSLRFNPLKKSIPALAEILNKSSLSEIKYINLTVENKIYLKNK